MGEHTQFVHALLKALRQIRVLLYGSPKEYGNNLFAVEAVLTYVSVANLTAANTPTK
jgi:hypothetical protein